MSSPNKEASSTIDSLPFRHGALDAEQIRSNCPQFRILIIGKANAGKTTILRKVCNAKPDIQPVIYDANGKEVQQAPTIVQRASTTVQQAPTKVGSPWESCSLEKLTKFLGSSDSRGSSRFFTGREHILQISPALWPLFSAYPLMSIISLLLRLRLSRPNPFITISDDLLAWRT